MNQISLKKNFNTKKKSLIDALKFLNSEINQIENLIEIITKSIKFCFVVMEVQLRMRNI